MVEKIKGLLYNNATFTRKFQSLRSNLLGSMGFCNFFAVTDSTDAQHDISIFFVEPKFKE